MATIKVAPVKPNIFIDLLERLIFASTPTSLSKVLKATASKEE